MGMIFNNTAHYLRSFYVTRAVQSYVHEDWNTIADEYYRIPLLLEKLHNARFPRYITTMRPRRNLRKIIHQILIRLVDFEALRVTERNLLRSALRDIGKKEHLQYVKEDLREERRPDAANLIKILEFLDSDLHSHEGANAEVTGALVGVLLGALISVAITLLLGG